jgi:type IV pilus assembly protein PilB
VIGPTTRRLPERPPGGGPRSLESIGLDAADCATARRLLDGPSGLVLLVGPPGAGLGTSATAMLRHLANSGRRPGDGVAHYPRLEGPLRVRRAVRAAERGVLVVGVVRHERACGVPALLRSWGMDRARVADALALLLAQRLLPGLCPACSEDDNGDDARRALAAAGSTWLAGRPIRVRKRAPSGCGSCHGSGSSGRVLVYELLEIDLRARSLLASGIEGPDLENALLGNGLGIWDSGLRQLAAGRASLESLRRGLREPR